MLDLLQFMQQDGYLSANELSALRRTAKELGESPVRLLRSLNIASPEQIQNFLQRHFKVLLLKEEALAGLSEDHQIFLPIDIALFYSCFGLAEENNELYIAMEDPSDRGLINQLRFLLDKKIVGICATVYQLAEGLTKIYNVPLTKLKLTTPLEKSRGVVGGVRYEESQESPLHNILLGNNLIKINETFTGVGLQDAEQETLAFDLSPNEIPSPKQNSQEQKENLLENEMIKELNYKVLNIMNIILTKLALLQKKEEAYDLLNTYLSPLHLSVMPQGENNLCLQGENFSVSASLQNLEEQSHPLFISLLPVLKKLNRLK